MSALASFARLAVPLVLVLASCDDAGAAKDPVWGKQACGSCAMLVSEPRYAAELTTNDGTRVFFDDPGCMAAWIAERHPSVHSMWVRDDVGHWVDAKSARFSGGATTPMDYGFAATTSGTATWADVEAAAKARGAK